MLLKLIEMKILASFGAIFIFIGWVEVCVASDWAIYLTAGILTATTIYDIWDPKNG